MGVTPRAIIAVCLTVLLLALIALASGGSEVEAGAGGAPGSPPRLTIPQATMGYLMVLAVVAASGIALLLVLTLQRPPRKQQDEAVDVGTPRPAWWSGPLVVVLVAAAVGLPILLLLWVGGPDRLPMTVPAGTGSSEGRVASPLTPAAGTAGSWPSSGPTPAVVVAAAAIAVGGLALVARRRRRPGVSAAERRREEPAEMRRRTIADIRSDPNPRHAVISAYACMERDFAESGLARRPSRAPFEYLEEVFEGLPVPPAPVRALTELFEVARFSAHPVDASMKRRAIDALVEVERALGVREP